MSTTTTAVPAIYRRSDDGTWVWHDCNIRYGWEFTADDAASTESLGEWLAEYLYGNGEGQWLAKYADVESSVITTGPNANDVMAIAMTCTNDDAIVDANLIADDTGSLNLVAVEFSDGGAMIIGAEPEGGYTWTTYSAADCDEQPLAERILTTDGDVTLASLADAIYAQSR